jgi:hypothetical protein
MRSVDSNWSLLRSSIYSRSKASSLVDSLKRRTSSTLNRKKAQRKLRPSLRRNQKLKKPRKKSRRRQTLPCLELMPKMMLLSLKMHLKQLRRITNFLRARQMPKQLKQKRISPRNWRKISKILTLNLRRSALRSNRKRSLLLTSRLSSVGRRSPCLCNRSTRFL